MGTRLSRVVGKRILTPFPARGPHINLSKEIYHEQNRSKIMGSNNYISTPQRAALTAFLASPQGHHWNASVPKHERYAIAKYSWGRVEGGLAIDQAFITAWDAWIATLPEPPKTDYKWSKGALAITIGP